MWWSKQSHSTSSSFSPSFSSTGTIDLPEAEEIRHPAHRPSRPPFNTWPDADVIRTSGSNSDLQLDAVVMKPILLKCNRLTIGPEAKASGVVIAKELIVYGEFTGNLRAIDRIEIKANAVVNGDLTARNIVIENGAIFSGTVQIERRKSPRGAPALAKSAGR